MNLQKFLREEVLTLRARVEVLEKKLSERVPVFESAVKTTPEALTCMVSVTHTGDDNTTTGAIDMLTKKPAPRWRVSWDDCGSRHETVFDDECEAVAEAILLAAEDYDHVRLEEIQKGGTEDAQKEG